jgi:GTP-binding protein
MGYAAFPISAVTRQGLDPLVYRMAEVIQQQAREIEAERADEVELITVKPNPDRIEVSRKRATYHVTGETAQRLAVMTDFSSPEAIYRLQRRLKRMGLFAALQREGIRDGNKVRIGDIEFIWHADHEELVPLSGSPSPTPS